MVRWIIACVVVVAGLANAEPKTVRTYAGQIVISPDPAPASSGELVDYLGANATKDHRYDLIKGPPWDINLVGVLAKDAGSESLTLVFASATDKKLTPIQSVDVPVKNGLVIAHITATTTAGFEATKTYVVRLLRKSTVLAKAELTLRY